MSAVRRTLEKRRELDSILRSLPIQERIALLEDTLVNLRREEEARLPIRDRVARMLSAEPVSVGDIALAIYGTNDAKTRSLTSPVLTRLRRQGMARPVGDGGWTAGAEAPVPTERGAIAASVRHVLGLHPEGLTPRAIRDLVHGAESTHAIAGTLSDMKRRGEVVVSGERKKWTYKLAAQAQDQAEKKGKGTK